MARPKPNPDEMLPLIKSTAVRLIKSGGYEQMTMKRLAAECNMSVGKLYHFFPSKDDLFLSLEIDYFNAIHDCIESSVQNSREQSESQRQVFRAMLEAYYRFATEHLELYKLVTSPPKVFANYLGTQKEGLAKQELVAAMRAIALFRHQFELVVKESGASLSSTELDSHFILFVNSVHGLILMSQSIAWPYISLDVTEAERAQLHDLALESGVADQLDLIVQKLL
jgi:AcrR family transcriptional regulator